MWEEIGFLKRSRTSKEILKCLDIPKTPSELKGILKLHLASISRALLKLEKMGLAKCLNPKADKFRIYSITKRGKAILKQLGIMENKTKQTPP